MTWVPLLRGPALRQYHLGFAQMIYDGKPLAKDGDEKSLGDIIFDSGSTYTYFTEKAHGALVSAVEENFANQLVRDPSDKTQPLCWRGKEPFSSITDPRTYLFRVILWFMTMATTGLAGFLRIARSFEVWPPARGFRRSPTVT
ncbi:hypothetical protein SUGI_0479640 [Cryptomeria japonica]|nr:hypothetical protein SUGI_0479640 [Cryptomeria japonica]